MKNKYQTKLAEYIVKVRTTTPKSVISAVPTVRLPIKDHAHWQDTPTELVVHDNVAEPVFKALGDVEASTLGKTEIELLLLFYQSFLFTFENFT